MDLIALPQNARALHDPSRPTPPHARAHAQAHSRPQPAPHADAPQQWIAHKMVQYQGGGLHNLGLICLPRQGWVGVVEEPEKVSQSTFRVNSINEIVNRGATNDERRASGVGCMAGASGRAESARGGAGDVRRARIGGRMGAPSCEGVMSIGNSFITTSDLTITTPEQ
jgi:hypothetical protein